MHILDIIQCWHKVPHNLEKSLLKSAKKEEKLYVYKSIDIIFLLHWKLLSKLKLIKAGKSESFKTKTDLVNVCFA